MIGGDSVQKSCRGCFPQIFGMNEPWPSSHFQTTFLVNSDYGTASNGYRSIPYIPNFKWVLESLNLVENRARKQALEVGGST